jgi:ankyrin repeat protein
MSHEHGDEVRDFLVAACVPLDAGHSSGTLERAEAILAAHPSVATRNIYAAAALGDEGTVRLLLARDPASATAKGGAHGWDALTYLCFSRYLRLNPARSDRFVQAARALLDAGASPNTGFFFNEHRPEPEFESVLYGAAGVAHHVELTRLLLQRGADPNDGEVVYHTPETWENGALKALLETGRLSASGLGVILLRKTDWHDYDGVRLALEHGADPNLFTPWGKTALHNAVLSDNELRIVELLLDSGADPMIRGPHPEVCRSAAGRSVVALAARRGRGDVLDLVQRRGFTTAMPGVDGLIADCARGDAESARAVLKSSPGLLEELRSEGGKLLAEFAGNGNTEGVRQLLNAGIDVNSRHQEGDGYFGLAPNSTALHSAAWRARPDTVRLLIGRGAKVDVLDGKGRSPLALAVRACVDSYWTDRRSPDSVEVLLQAGAPISGVPFPSGYADVDNLLQAHRAKA